MVVISNEEGLTMRMLDHEPDPESAKDVAPTDHAPATPPHPVPSNKFSGPIPHLTPEEQARNAKAIAELVEFMLSMPDEDPPGAWEEAMRHLDEQRPHRKLFEGLLD